MKNGQLVAQLVIMPLVLALVAGTCHAEGQSPILVAIRGPSQPLKMGDTPTFKGKVANVGNRVLKGLVVYLSLVSLKPGGEHPADLEDWSAQKAVRIDALQLGQSNKQDWPMRLIEAGHFGVVLTVVDPGEKQPIVSDLVTFNIQSKPTLSSNRILPVAIGEPLFLLFLYALHWFYMRSRYCSCVAKR